MILRWGQGYEHVRACILLWELRPSFSPRRGNRVCSTGVWKGKVSGGPHTLCEPNVGTSVWGWTHVSKQEQSHFVLHVGRDCSWIFSETKWGEFGLFNISKLALVLQLVGVVGTGERAFTYDGGFSRCWCDSSTQYRWESDPELEEAEEEMAASQVTVLS